MTDTNTAAALSAEADGLTDLEDAISDAIGDSMDMDWTYRDGAKAVVRMLVDQDWLTRRIATDPDIPCEAGGHVATPAPAALEGSSSGEGEAMRWSLGPSDPLTFENYSGSVDEPTPSEWAVQAWKDSGDAYASYMGDPDGHDDTDAARTAAALAIERAALRALQPSSAADAKPVACSDEALEIANANHEKFERLWYLAKDDVDRLKLAICGGEDVPGAIDAVSVEDCEGFIAEERSRHIDTEARLEYVRRSRDGAADRADRLYRALVEVRDSVETYPLDDSQTCMCGSPVEGHNVGSGHAPVSQADHAISLIVEAIDKALGVAAIPDHALIGAGRPDDYEGPDVGMHDTEIVESEND